MNEPHKAELLRALKPVTRSQKRLEGILNEFWSTRASIIWTTTQVHRAANENKTVLTEQDAQTILQEFIANHHYQYGLCWMDLVNAIKEAGVGRKITSAETRNLVLRNILTVDPP